jgi:hypothetical protein
MHLKDASPTPRSIELNENIIIDELIGDILKQSPWMNDSGNRSKPDLLHFHSDNTGSLFASEVKCQSHASVSFFLEHLSTEKKACIEHLYSRFYLTWTRLLRVARLLPDITDTHGTNLWGGVNHNRCPQGVLDLSKSQVIESMSLSLLHYWLNTSSMLLCRSHWVFLVSRVREASNSIGHPEQRHQQSPPESNRCLWPLVELWGMITVNLTLRNDRFTFLFERGHFNLTICRLNETIDLSLFRILLLRFSSGECSSMQDDDRLRDRWTPTTQMTLSESEMQG